MVDPTLRSFIEVGRVAFITFDDDVIAIGDTKADAEVLGGAAYQTSGIESALVLNMSGKNPSITRCQHIVTMITEMPGLV